MTVDPELVALAVPMPSRIRALRRDRADRPVPWFVATIDGSPDFRVIRPGGIDRAYLGDLCWICGQRRPRKADDVFVIGSMCAVNRVSAEPPSHADCAVYAALACPFLTNPKKRRREGGLADLDAHSPAGEMISRNPGVALCWFSKRWRAVSDGRGGMLFDVGEPTRTLWFAEGRAATRAEVLESIDSGLPLLQEMAEAQSQAAVEALRRMYERALTLVPTS